MWNGARSYPDLIVSHYQASVPHLTLVDMACSGETTSSMISHSLCAPGGSQYRNALSFLRAHAGKVALVTIDIGGNDVVDCIFAANPTPCFVNGLKTMQKNLATIVTGLRTATHSDVPIIGMNYYDPLLGDWLAGPGPTRTLTTQAITGVATLNTDMTNVYAKAAIPVADVAAAYQSSDMTHFVSSRWGRIPVAVDRACEWLDITCRRGAPEGFGDDPNNTGATVIADAFAKTIGTLHAPVADPQIGGVLTFGHAASYGTPNGSRLSAPVVDMASTPDGRGYWLVGADGGVFSFGDAGFYGSEGGTGVMTPFVGIAPTRDGHGYWIAGDFGNVYSFGDAPSENSIARSLNAPVVGIAADPKAAGYWLVGADGGVFTFGHAAFHGSMGNVHLNEPIVGMAATPDGRGYWLVAADGGVFTFGDAAFYGSMGNVHLNEPIVGMAATPDGRGYWLVAADGGVFTFGDAGFYGSTGNHPPNPRTPVVAITAARHGVGYWLATTARLLPPPTLVPSVLDQCNQPGSAPSIEPTTIVLACADANALLTHLSWSTWTATGAAATGFFTFNLCRPDCAQGTFISVPARIQLNYPIETSTGQEFATVSYSYANPNPPGNMLTFTEFLETSAG